MEDINKELAAIWEEYASIDNEVLKERGYLYCNNIQQKDILITGINPSFTDNKKGQELPYEFMNCNSGRYWIPIKNMLKSNECDYINSAAYFDLFYFRETNQKYIRNVILKHKDGLQFLVRQLRVTQQLMEEVIRPKVIIIKNKESYAYWGKLSDKGYIWMGYEFESIGNCSCGEICRITGFIESNERILPELVQSNLVGSIVLFSKYNRYLKKEEKVTVEIIRQLLDL